MTGIKKWIVTEPYLDIRCGLGAKDHIYEATTNTLHFADIKKKQLHTVDLAIGPESLKTLQLDTPVGVTAGIEDVDLSKRILVRGKSGICVLDRETGKWSC